MAGFSSTVTPVRRAVPKPANPFFAQAAGKPWNAPIAAAQPETPRLAPRPGPTPAAPGAAGQTAGTSGTQTTAQPSLPPLDATASGNIAQNQFDVNNKINSLNSQSGADTLALQNALAQLAYQQPRDQLSLEQGANRNGALYSSVYNQNLGDLNHNYLTKQNAATTQNDQQQSSIAAQIQALLGGVPLYNEGQESAAAQRAITAAAANPATGQPTALAPAAPKVSGTISDSSWKAVPAPKAKAKAPKVTQSSSWKAG